MVMLEGISLIITDRRSTASPNTDDVCLEMQKNMFFSNHVFYAKRKVFFIEKNSFLMFFLFFSITGRFLINYSAIRVYL